MNDTALARRLRTLLGDPEDRGGSATTPPAAPASARQGACRKLVERAFGSGVWPVRAVNTARSRLGHGNPSGESAMYPIRHPSVVVGWPSQPRSRVTKWLPNGAADGLKHR